MNKHVVEGNWKEFKGKVKEQWGKLTGSRLDVVDGKRENLTGKTQEAYGNTKDDVEKQANEFEDTNKS